MGSGKTFYEFSIKAPNGQSLHLEQFRGKVVIAVNVSSKCSYTEENYRQLAEILDKYRSQGLRVLLFPSDEFQQTGENSMEASSYAACYNQQFLMTEMITVNGKDAHPIIKWLKSGASGSLFNSAIKWNFTKFLIDRHGRVHSKRYGSEEDPNKMIRDVEKLLAERE